MVPAAGWASPARTFVSVVLPAPLRPTSPTRSPAPMRKLAPSTNRRAPARSSTLVAVITEVLAGFGERSQCAGGTRARRQDHPSVYEAADVRGGVRQRGCTPADA